MYRMFKQVTKESAVLSRRRAPLGARVPLRVNLFVDMLIIIISKQFLVNDDELYSCIQNIVNKGILGI